MTTEERERAKSLGRKIIDEIYRPYKEEKDAFGEHWCGPDKYPHLELTLIALFPKTNDDGQGVTVYCTAAPVRFYELEVKGGTNSVGTVQEGYTLTTGSGMAKMAALIAETIASGMLEFKPDNKEAEQ